MKHWIRAALGCAAAGAVALCAGAGSGGAALNPAFQVTSTGTGANLFARIADSDPSPARLAVYVPAGYGFTGAAAGKQAGIATVNVITDIGPSEAALFGTVTSGSVTPTAEDTACDATAHAAQFTVTATGSTTEYSFHLFLDRTTGTEAQLGPYKLVACFSAANARPLTDKGGTNDARVVAIRLRNLPFRAPARGGDYRWRAVWTPYTTNGGDGTNGTPTNATIDVANSAEAESVVHGPLGVTIAARHATLTGRVAGAGAGRTVVVYTGTSRLHLFRSGSTRTRAGGAFTLTLHPKHTTYVRVEVQIPGRNLGAAGCVASPALKVTCGGATTASAQLTSRTVALRP